MPHTQLACARLGAVFSVVFAGFSAESLAGRISDSSPKMVVTCSAVKRGPKHIHLKKIVDEALQILGSEEQVRVLVGGLVDRGPPGRKGREGEPSGLPAAGRHALQRSTALLAWLAANPAFFQP